MRSWIAIATCCLLMGCGFHLRGQDYTLKQYFAQLSVESANNSTEEQRQALLDALTAAGVNTTPTTNGPHVVLSESRIDTEPLAFGIDGEVRRERITAQVTFSFEEGTAIYLPKQVLTTAQERIRYANYDLSDASDKEKIIEDLQITLAHQIMLRLELWSQSRKTTP